MRLRLFLLVLVFASQVSTTLASSAAAQQQDVVILGLRSIEGDDEIARNLSQLLRERAHGSPQWRVAAQTITLSQMVLAHGCEEVDVQCMASVAQGLGVQLVVYGTMQRSSVQDDFNFTLQLDMFDATTGAIAQSATSTFTQGQATLEGLPAVAEVLIARLSPAPATASLLVKAPVEGASVIVDGQDVGLIENGSFSLPEITPGLHQVRVQAIGYEEFSAVLQVDPAVETAVNASLLSKVRQEAALEAPPILAVTHGKPQLVPDWMPYGLMGVGAAGVGGMLATWLVISGIEDENAYITYSDAAYNFGKQDVCDVARIDQHSFNGRLAAEQVRVSKLCDRADTYEALQYVFGGIGLAGIASGVLLLILDRDDSKSTAGSPPSFAVRPTFSPTRAGVHASMHF